MPPQVDLPLAPLWRRGIAWGIDVTIGAALALGFVIVAGGMGDARTLWHALIFKSFNGKTGQELSNAMHPGSAGLAGLAPLARLLIILTIVAGAAIAYRVVTTARWGAGVGKLLLGMRIVVDSPGHGLGAPGWSRSWKRWVVPQGPGLIPLPATSLLAYLPALRDSRRRGLHDRVAGTVVIDVRRHQRAASRQILGSGRADGGIDAPARELAPIATIR
jgi:RDD family